MIYLATSRHASVRAEMIAGGLGCMNTPDTAFNLDDLPGVPWAADNGAFSKRWEPGAWLAWLASNRQHLDRCLFAAVPDVVGDHAATLEQWALWAPTVRELGYPVAFVCQNGADPATIPWDDLDWIFLGGAPECLACSWVRPVMDKTADCPTCGARLREWKESAAALELAAAARARGKRIHVGRVNTLRRLRISAVDIGADTVDGTYHAFGPEKNVRRMRRFLLTAGEAHLFEHG